MRAPLLTLLLILALVPVTTLIAVPSVNVKPPQPTTTVNYSRSLLLSGAEIPQHELPETASSETSSQLPLGFYTTFNVLFDQGHGQYWDASKLSSFIDDLRALGLNVTINNGTFTYDLLSAYDLVILPYPKTLNETEIAALKEYLKSGGALLIMGEWYGYYSYNLTPVTEDFGIAWLNTSIYDDTNYDYRNYYPLVHVWTPTDVAALVSDNSRYTVKFSGTALWILGNSTNYTVYAVGTGDNDTYTKGGPDGGAVMDGNIIFFAATEIQGGGRLFASGSSKMLSDTYFYLKFNNRDFALRVVYWLLSRSILEIVRYNVPEKIYIGEYYDIGVVVRNNAGVNATNVVVTVNVSGPVEILNGSCSVTFPYLAPGEERRVVLRIRASRPGAVDVTFSVNSTNVPGGFIETQFEIEGRIELSAWLEPHNYVVLPSWDYVDLWVNVTNPGATGINATNVSVTITLEYSYGIVETANVSLNYTVDILPNGTSLVLCWHFVAKNFTRGALVRILVNASTANLGFRVAVLSFYVFTQKYVLLDQAHKQYWDTDKLGLFISLLKNLTNYNVFINNETLTPSVVGNACLIIIPSTGRNATLSSEEVTLIKEFVKSGGKLLLMGDWYSYFEPEEQKAFNALTSEFGIVWNIGEIMDNASNVDGRPYFVVLTPEAYATNYFASWILSSGQDYIYYPGGTFLNVSPPAVPVLFGNPTSYGVDQEGKPTGLTGRQLVAVAVYYDLNSGAKVVACGSSAMFAQYYRYTWFSSNIKLIHNIIRWLLEFKSIDTTAPAVWFVAPENETWLSSSRITVRWAGTDDTSIVWYELYVDGSKVALLPGTVTEYELSLTAGMHTIKVVAYDCVGRSDSAILVVGVDTEKPSIEIISPTYGANITMYNYTVVDITWRASDNFGLARFEIYVNGTLIAVIPATGTSGDFTFKLGIDQQGMYIVRVYAYDLAGNSEWSEVAFVVTKLRLPAPPPPRVAWEWVAVAAVLGIAAGFGAGYYVVKRRSSR